MNSSDRIPCCVPFCGRTLSRKRFPWAHEVICGPHYRGASKILRLRHARLRRKLNRLTTLDKAYGRLVDLDWRLWERIKRQAIERAAGV